VTRIAVVSNDGIHVDGHFGKADRFLIFDVKGTELDLVETRSSTPLSVNDPQHSFDAERFESVYQVIQDCQKVFVTQIGDKPASKLREQGIEPILYAGPISTIPL
jgi:predicted Fe-Mo cluster-binding NifX family protein